MRTAVAGAPAALIGIVANIAAQLPRDSRKPAGRPRRFQFGACNFGQLPSDWSFISKFQQRVTKASANRLPDQRRTAPGFTQNRPQHRPATRITGAEMVTRIAGLAWRNSD